VSGIAGRYRAGSNLPPKVCFGALWHLLDTARPLLERHLL
jgi:hypothetical protein